MAGLAHRLQKMDRSSTNTQPPRAACSGNLTDHSVRGGTVQSRELQPIIYRRFRTRRLRYYSHQDRRRTRRSHSLRAVRASRCLCRRPSNRPRENPELPPGSWRETRHGCRPCVHLFWQSRNWCGRPRKILRRRNNPPSARIPAASAPRHRTFLDFAKSATGTETCSSISVRSYFAASRSSSGVFLAILRPVKAAENCRKLSPLPSPEREHLYSPGIISPE